LSRDRALPKFVTKNRRIALVTNHQPNEFPRIKLLAVVEATTVNAVAKNLIEFHRSVKELSERDHNLPLIELSLVTFDRARKVGAAPNEFISHARDSGIEVDVIPERGRFDRQVIPALRNIVEQREPALVATHSVKSHFIMLRSRLWRKYPWVAFHHGYTTTDRKMRFYNQFDRWSLAKADRVVTVCEAFAQELIETKGVPRDRITVQHNSIRPEPRASSEEVERVRAQLGSAKGEQIILAVGRLSREKAQGDLIEAFKLLLETHPELKARLVIVGDGPERGNLESAATSLRISDRVAFVGHVNKILTYYAAADVLANASHSEGSPYVLLEAMAAEVPIVATAVGGVPEILKDEESGLLVPVNDPIAMAEGISRILNDDQFAHRLTTKALDLISTRFTRENYVRSVTEIYRDVLDRRSPS
jgi:glycosyltransferase involved in cell wall biosynthesis